MKKSHIKIEINAKQHSISVITDISCELPELILGIANLSIELEKVIKHYKVPKEMFILLIKKSIEHILEEKNDDLISSNLISDLLKETLG